MRIRGVVTAYALGTLFFTVSACAHPGAPGKAAPERQWSALEYQLLSTDMQRAEYCEFPWRIRFLADGSYVAGPCAPGLSLTSGRLSVEELGQLERVVLKLTDETQEGAPQCHQQAIALERVVIDLSVAGRALRRVYDSSSGHPCFYGNPETISELQGKLMELRDRYYPRRSATAAR